MIINGSWKRLHLDFKLAAVYLKLIQSRNWHSYHTGSYRQSILRMMTSTFEITLRIIRMSSIWCAPVDLGFPSWCPAQHWFMAGTSPPVIAAVQVLRLHQRVQCQGSGGEPFHVQTESFGWGSQNVRISAPFIHANPCQTYWLFMQLRNTWTPETGLPIRMTLEHATAESCCPLYIRNLCLHACPYEAW